MIFHHVWDEVFSTWSHVAVLRALQDVASGASGREIARTAGMSHRACLQALTALESLSIVVRKRGGRDHFFSLNREHGLVSEGILPLLALERDFLGKLSQLIKQEMGNVCESLILFGSVARKEETVTSDIDLCIVLRETKDEKKILKQVHEFSPLLKRQFGANLSVFVISKSEFMKRARMKKPPVAEVTRDGIVISGSSLRELARG